MTQRFEKGDRVLVKGFVFWDSEPRRGTIVRVVFAFDTETTGPPTYEVEIEVDGGGRRRHTVGAGSFRKLDLIEQLAELCEEQ